MRLIVRADGDVSVWTTAGPREPPNTRYLREPYLTVTPEFHLRVGERLRKDYANGRTYYPFDGAQVASPSSVADLPSADYLAWHNEHVFRG